MKRTYPEGHDLCFESTADATEENRLLYIASGLVPVAAHYSGHAKSRGTALQIFNRPRTRASLTHERLGNTKSLRAGEERE